MSNLVEKSFEYVTLLFAKELPSNCIYHNLTHTKRVVKSTKEIVKNTKLTEEDEEDVLLAAVFHDTGYINGPEDHEIKSTEIASDFLKKEGHDEKRIQKISECILATKLDQTPTNLLEKIIRDADASHFAKDYFQEASEFLRLELNHQNETKYTKEEWLSGNIKMLGNDHQYYTDYAIENWNPKKEENLAEIGKIQKKLKKDLKKKKKNLKKSLKKNDPEKAVQSVFRVTLRNHIKLSDIADTKANILLSVNAIIISIALSNLIPKLDNPSNTYLLVPTVIFLIFTVTAIIMSVLATRPNVTSGTFTKEDVEKKRVNLLFFGNFHKMNEAEYQWAMNEMLNDKEYIYSSLTKDLYYLGLVLQRKYKLLRLTYTIFLIGIVISVIAFAIAFQLNGARG